MSTDVEESRKWNARARVGIMLDQKDCAKEPRTPWYMVFEGRLIANNMPLREDEVAWARSVDEALSWHASRSDHQPMVWYCGPNNLLPKEAATVGREGYWKKIKEHNDKKLVAK